MLRRTAKDSVFCHLFSQEEYLLELYRQLHPEDGGARACDLELVTVERVVTDGEYNDLGFTARGRLVVLVEAQTTWSANIVTRMLLYLAETYRRMVAEGRLSLHKGEVVRLPAPELYVVWAGTGRNVPESASFRRDVLGRDEGCLELEVRVLRGGCGGVVGQYVEFARVFDEVRASGAPAQDKARRVVEECVSRGILEGYFEGFEAEVTDIMFTLFDQERETRLYHEQIRREAAEEGRAEGLAEGRAEGRLQGLAEAARQLMRSAGIGADEAMDALGVRGGDRDALAASLR